MSLNWDRWPVLLPDRSAGNVQVDMILNQAQNLPKMNDQYVETYVVRGTKELRALLGASCALRVNQSTLSDHILQRMREKLEEDHEIWRAQANSPSQRPRRTPKPPRP